MISGTQDISLSSPWDSRHQQHFTTSHHHSSVPQLHGTQKLATLHSFTPPLISPSSPWDSNTSNTSQVHTTIHQSIISMGLMGLTSSHNHSSVHHLHGTHKFMPPLSVHHLHRTWTQATLHKFTPPPTPNITTPDCLSVSLSATTILVHFLQPTFPG